MSGIDENDDERPSMDAIERYLGRVKAVVISLTGTSRQSRLRGPCSLAWSIADNDIAVPPWKLDAIRELTTDLIEPQDMPGELWPDSS